MGGWGCSFGQKQAEINARLQNILINSYLHLRRRSSHMKMSPLHLEHLLGFRLLCLVTGISHSTARTRRHQLNHRPSCTSRTLAVLAQPRTTCKPTCRPWQPAISSWSITARRSPWECSTWAMSTGKLLASPPGSCVTWPQTWPFPTTAAGACSSATKMQRCVVALHAGTHTQLCTCAMQKAPLHGQSLLPQSPTHLCTSAWACCFTDRCMGAGKWQERSLG